MTHAALLVGGIMVAWVLLRVVSIERELRIAARPDRAETRAEHEEQIRAAEEKRLAQLRAEEKRREEGKASPPTSADVPAAAEISGKPA